MKDALQAELRNTLKRKIKQQDQQGDGDGRKNEEIERAIEHTRNEVQLKLNGPSGVEGAPKVDNPLKLLVDMVDKERGVSNVAPSGAPSGLATPKQPSPVPSVKGNVSNGVSPTTQKIDPTTNGSALKKVSIGQGPVVNGKSPPTPQNTQAMPNGSGTLKKVSIGQGPVVNGMSPPVQKTQPMPNGSGTLKKVSIGQGPVANGMSPPIPQNTQHTSIGSTTLKKVSIGQSSAENGTSAKLNVSTTPWKSTSPATAKISSPVNGATPNSTPVSNGNGKSPSGVAVTNGTVLKSPVPSRNTSTGITAGLSPSSPTATSSVASKIILVKRTNAGSALASPKTAAPVSSTTPPVFSSTVKISVGSYGDANKLASNGSSPVVRNGVPSKIEPLTIEVGSSSGNSTNGTASPSTPKELLSPQVRSGAASIRPSQIRTLTKAGSVVSHTDIVETPRQLAKLPISLIEPEPVLTAAAAASPPPASPRMASATTNSSPAKERTTLHGRPNFTIKRSNSRQGFDVDVPDSRSDTVKPVFRILTDLEQAESEQDQREQRSAGGQQQYVSFAKDLSNAPNNHPDVAVVTKTVIKPSEPSDPFLATLKDIKIDIGEMKIVNAKDA
ncbi:AGAP010641-PA-like protein [Anopheles sinensis]|uniref:AGAP010641-PA-like protein n=1 Tax=Anopheles sinensis TaxID=74873 RepID=A0A084WLS8_ANOSI|nr:AGAP010641-PA-like protein [Anopheles sinensis]